MTLADVAVVEGVQLRLRLVQPEDAAFIYSLRTDPSLNVHLAEVTGTVDDQRRWIERYKAREQALGELYYVIERKDASAFGLVRLYNIAPDIFTWGSWVLGHDKPKKAALESAVLSFGIGFRTLRIPQAIIEVRRDNAHAIAFYQRFGARRTGENELDLLFEYSQADYDAAYEGFMAILEGERQA